MRAVLTRPGAGRAWLADVPEPELQRADDVLVQMQRVGICGTDRHVMARPAGSGRGLPDGDDYLVIGHEAVGRVVQVGPGVDDAVRVGETIVPTVRRGCGTCEPCAVGQADLCSSGRYRERGIVGLHGFLSEYIVDRAENLVVVPEALATVAPLVESLCTPEKALRRIGNARAHLPMEGPLNGVRRALVTGSGPIALLAVLALRLRDIPTWVLARQPADALPAQLVERASATYVPLSEVDLDQPQTRLGAFDAVIEATGAAELSVAMLGALAPNGVVDLVGGTTEATAVPIRAAALGAMVGRNLTLLGSVNANRADWMAAVRDLTQMQRAYPGVIEALITHTFEMADVDVAFERVPGQIKAVIEIRRPIQLNEEP